MSNNFNVNNIMPVLLGADMNCYSMARTFHEAYGVKSYAFGRWPMGETKYSRIVKFTAVENIDTNPVMLKTLTAFAEQNKDKTKIILGCTDDYAAMIIQNKAELSKNYIVPYINSPLMETLVSKENFYKYCDEFKIPYPKTHFLHFGFNHEEFEQLNFEYPIVIKPSSSIEYWKNPFANMKKVYFAKNAKEAIEISNTIFNSGYNDSLIIQDLIPGSDGNMRVLTAYCDQNHKVRMMCLGHVLLEEHTPKAIGNHAAILTEYNPELMEKLAFFLENIHYTGFANFDIKFDERDNTYKTFEINLRQGRSNYYVTGAGLNLAKYIVDDYIFKKPFEERLLFNKESYWHSIPTEIVRQYTENPALVEQALHLEKQGQCSTTLGYQYDLRFNPLRRLYLAEHNRRYYKKYATYCDKIR